MYLALNKLDSSMVRGYIEKALSTWSLSISHIFSFIYINIYTHHLHKYHIQTNYIGNIKLNTTQVIIFLYLLYLSAKKVEDEN